MYCLTRRLLLHCARTQPRQFVLFSLANTLHPSIIMRTANRKSFHCVLWHSVTIFSSCCRYCLNWCIELVGSLAASTKTFPQKHQMAVDLLRLFRYDANCMAKRVAGHLIWISVIVFCFIFFFRLFDYLLFSSSRKHRIYLRIEFIVINKWPHFIVSLWYPTIFFISSIFFRFGCRRVSVR